VFFFAVVLLLCLSGCATPNIQPFADGAAKFSSSVRLTNTEVESRFKPLATSNAGIKEELGRFSEAAKIYNDMASLSASYSAALAELAAAGETGGEAAQKISDSIAGFGELLHLTTPALLPASLATSAAGKSILKAAELWNRAQAQESLQESMEIADQAVQEMADALEEVYGRPINGINKPYQDIIENLVSLEISRQKVIVGAGRLFFYKDSAKTEAQAIADMMQGKTINEQTESILRMRERVKPDVQAYERRKRELDEWQAKQLALSYLIAGTAKAWAQEHHRLKGWLEKCGGVRYLKNDCGQFSAPSLNAFVSDIQFIWERER